MNLPRNCNTNSANFYAVFRRIVDNGANLLMCWCDYRYWRVFDRTLILLAFGHIGSICLGNRTMTTVSCKNGAITLPRMNVSGCVGHATLFIWLLTRAISCFWKWGGVRPRVHASEGSIKLFLYPHFLASRGTTGNFQMRKQYPETL